MTAERRQLDIRDTASLAFPGDRWYFMALLNSADLAIALMDEQGLILTVNPAFESLFGYTLAEVEGRHIDLVVSGNNPEITTEVLKHTARVLKGENTYIPTTRRVRKDGSLVDVDLFGVPVMRGDERLGGLAIYTDISARQAAEEALRKSEERYRNVFEYSKDALAITTPEGLILDVNDSLLELLGLTRDELMARRSSDLYVNPEERVEMISTIKKLGFVNDFPTQLYKSDGSIMDMLISTVVREATEDHPEVYQSTLRDITEQKRIANALQRQASELELLHQARSAFAQELNLKSFIKTVVEAIADTFGYTLVSMYLLEDGVLHLQHEVGYEQVITEMPIDKGIMGRVARTGKSFLLEDVTQDPDFIPAIDGLISEITVPVLVNDEVIGVLNVESTAGVVLNEDDLALMEALGGFVSSAFQRARLFTQLSDSQERLQTLIDNLPISLFTVDTEGVFTLSEGAGLATLGRKSGEAVGQSIFEMYADHPQIPRNVRRALQGESFKDDVVIGEQIFDSSYSPLYNKKGHITGVLGLSTIITERVKAEKQLRYNAFHDTLTHLPNRALFMERLEQVVIRSTRIPEYLFAILFMDLDRLKHVNDSLGHQVGDKLLVEIGKRVKGCIRPGDTIARLGGDEFAILCDNISGVSDAVRIAERVQEQMGEAFLIEGHTIYASFSTGVSIRGTDAMDAEAYLRDADLAMYRAKQQGAGSFAIFDQSLHEQAVERLGLETDLRTALKEQQFVVHYQPICNLADGQVLGFEALVRWQHPQRGSTGTGRLLRNRRRYQHNHADRCLGIASRPGRKRRNGMQLTQKTTCT